MPSRPCTCAPCCASTASRRERCERRTAAPAVRAAGGAAGRCRRVSARRDHPATELAGRRTLIPPRVPQASRWPRSRGTWPRSPFFAPQSRESRRRCLDSRCQRERRRQIVEIPRRGLHLACGPQPLERAPSGQRGEQRHRTAAIGDLNRLAALDPAQQLARVLAQLADSDRSHGATRSTKEPAPQRTRNGPLCVSGIRPSHGQSPLYRGALHARAFSRIAVRVVRALMTSIGRRSSSTAARPALRARSKAAGNSPVWVTSSP